jgi:hypothetical protein
VINLSEDVIAVILNELKHIREDLAEVKGDMKNKCSDCSNVKLLENEIKCVKEKQDKFEDIPIRVSKLENSGTILSKILPYILMFLGWLTGGGWKYFVG